MDIRNGSLETPQRPTRDSHAPPAPAKSSHAPTAGGGISLYDEFYRALKRPEKPQRPTHDSGSDYVPFQPEDDTRKRKGANQLRVALVQASGLPEGSPLVVFEVVSNDQVLHRWRSQERKKTSQPVWRQQWAVALDAKASCPKLRARLEDVSRGELMGDLSIDLTTVLDREIHRGWHKLVGEATDESETITVELGGAVELVVQWRHSTSKVKAVVPPRTPKPAVASPAGDDAMVATLRHTASISALGVSSANSSSSPTSLFIRFALSDWTAATVGGELSASGARLRGLNRCEPSASTSDGGMARPARVSVGTASVHSAPKPRFPNGRDVDL